jgi:phosphatidylglycerol:prolipoprotein diacylglycerol transferase
VVFPGGGPLPRHPSQLYEAFLEGLVLWAILWIVLKRVKNYGIISSLFLLGYGVFRFIVEFFREPDQQLGFYFGSMTMGQILCFLMILAGVGLFFYVVLLGFSIAFFPIK